MNKLLLAGSAAFSSIPGLLVIASGLGTPPGYKVLFGGVIEAFGVLALLILWVNRTKLERTEAKKITKFALGLAIISILSLITYIYLFSFCVVTAEGRPMTAAGIPATAYYPLVLTGDIARIVDESGSRKAAIDAEGIATIIEEIDKLPAYYLSLTTIVLLLTYQMIFTTLTIAFGLLGIHRGTTL